MLDIDVFLTELRSYLNSLFVTYDKIWIDRRRVFSSELMFSAIFAQVLNKESTNSRLVHSQLHSLLDTASPDFSASSYSKARKRFPFEFFADLCQWLYKFHSISPDERWFGYSIFAIDSMKFDVPKELEHEGFDSMNDCDSYYPKAMLTALYDLQLGMIYDSVVSQHGDERESAIVLFDSLPDNSLVICDRGFPSFNIFYQAKKRRVELLMRIGIDQAPDELLEFIESDSIDEIVTMSPSLESEKKALSRGLVPQPVEVRAIKYLIKGTEFVVITTITDEELTLKDIASLYHLRWGIEEEFKLNKVGLKLEDFKTKHLDGVLQEIWATQAVSAISRVLAICTSGIPPKTFDRVQHSILGIVKILRVGFLQILSAKANNLIERISNLKRALQKTIYKFRPGRSYDRKSKKNINRWSLRREGVSC